MKKIKKYLLIPILLLSITCTTKILEIDNFLESRENLENNKLYITYFGTACFLIEDSKHSILIDPGDLFTNRFTKTHAANLLPVDLIIITHNDFDHVNRLEYIEEADTVTIIGTISVKNDFPQFKVITNNSYINDWVEISKIDIAHGLRPNEDHTGYKIEFAGKTIIFLGDGAKPLEPIEPNPDFLFVTIGGIEASVRNGIELTNQIKPVYVIPMHWEILSRNNVRVRRFDRKLNKESADTKCIIPEFYTRFTVD